MPYDAPAVTTLLRRMPAGQLARVHPHDFQRWPAKVVIRGATILDLISNERARRAA